MARPTAAFDRSRCLPAFSFFLRCCYWVFQYLETPQHSLGNFWRFFFFSEGKLLALSATCEESVFVQHSPFYKCSAINRLNASHQAVNMLRKSSINRKIFAFLMIQDVYLTILRVIATALSSVIHTLFVVLFSLHDLWSLKKVPFRDSFSFCIGVFTLLIEKSVLFGVSREMQPTSVIALHRIPAARFACVHRQLSNVCIFLRYLYFQYVCVLRQPYVKFWSMHTALFYRFGEFRQLCARPMNLLRGQCGVYALRQKAHVWGHSASLGSPVWR